MKCIIHIGVHKTGSTSIQLAFDGYKTEAYSYADMGTPNHTTPFQTLFSTDAREKYWTRLGQSADEKRRIYEERLDAALQGEQDTIIFSGEGISLLDIAELKRMRSRLEKTCTEFTVVMFVRDPLSWTMSSMQEACKHGSPLQDISSQHVSERYRNVRQVFGEDEVCVIKYEDKKLFDGDVVAQFCSVLNLPLPLEYKPRFSNISMRSDSFNALVIQNRSLGSLRIGSEFEKAHWDFVRLVTRLFKDSPKLDKADFLPFCSFEEYDFFKKEFGIVYEKPNTQTPNAEEPFKLSDGALEIIAEYLRARGSQFNWSCDRDNAVRAL